MGMTMKQPAIASQRDSLAAVRPEPIKADLRPQVSASGLLDLASHAITSTHGKQLVAAEVLGLSESQLGRLISEGDLKLKHLEGLGVETLAALGKALQETYGPLSTPRARAHQLIRDARAIFDELDQVAEEIAS
jgi:hypothetical protein